MKERQSEQFLERMVFGHKKGSGGFFGDLEKKKEDIKKDFYKKKYRSKRNFKKQGRKYGNSCGKLRHPT